MPLLSLSSQIAFRLASGEAQALESKNIDSEHLFLGLCKLDAILDLKKSAFSGIDEAEWKQAMQDIKVFTTSLSDAGVDPRKTRRLLRRLLKEFEYEKGDFSGHRTQRCRDAFSIAEEICKHTEAKEVFPSHFCAALLGQDSEPLNRLFSELSMDKDAVLGALEMNEGADGKIRNDQNDAKRGKTIKPKPQKKKTPILNKYGKDLTEVARKGRLQAAIGRDHEIKKIAQILIQKNKNNPVLIGDAGVGKTAVVEGFALKVVEPKASRHIRDFRIIELNMGALVAGTKYRGEFEERLQGLLDEAASDPNIVLFIDEIHTMVGAGAAGGSMDAGNILKPALARGVIKYIGATTTAEYRKHIEKDPALDRRFQVVWIDEPTKEQAIQIMKGIREKFEEHHGIKIPDEVIAKLVELTIRYIPDFKLPDKAIDILDQACARVMFKTFTPGTTTVTLNEVLTLEDIARVISERCRIPVESLTAEDRDRLLKIEEHLRQRVKGQDLAVSEVGKTIRSAKSGLKDPDKPVVFFFVGSTGTGKTELAKGLAEFLFHDANTLITFDMSEYQEKHSVAKLIGSPPGYVGHDEEGQLTGKVRSNPYSVILFDEIEKAHPDIFDIFLQIFDEGRLTDARGRRVSFSESVVILTSNLGSSVDKINVKKDKKGGVSIGFKMGQVNSDMKVNLDDLNIDEGSNDWDEYERHIRQAIGKAFRPELLNRIQKTITFYPLNAETVKQIILSKILPALNKRLGSKDIQVDLSDEAMDYLMEIGYNIAYGAREMQRVFERNITEPLSQLILNEKIKAGQKVTVGVNAQGFTFL